MSKRWVVGFIFLLAWQAYADTDDYNLAKYSELIVRGRLHAQSKTVKYPNSEREYPVPFRLEITQVFKEGVEEPKVIEITDSYYDMCDTLDSLALTKKFQALDGKEVVAFLMRTPPSKYEKMNKTAKKRALEYYLGYSNPFHLCGPSPNSLRLYSSSVSQTIEECLKATPVPTPNWDRVVSEANFSFLDTAIHRPDNDMDVGPSREGAQTKIPKKVQTVFQAEAKSDFKNYMGFMAGDLTNDAKDPDFKNDIFVEKNLPTPQNTYGPVYLIEATNGLEVYVMMTLRFGTDGGWSYSLVLYDPKTDRVSANSKSISGYWLEGLGKDMRMFKGDRSLERPFISFEDINSEGQKTLVVEELVHNGTALSGSLYHYFFIEKDLSLKEILGLEARSFNIDDEDFWFFRKITDRKKNEITVDMTMEKLKEAPIPIGTMILRSDGNDTPFKLVHKEIRNKKYDFFIYPSKDGAYIR